MEFDKTVFHPDMVGKRVREIDTGDEGIVNSRRVSGGWDGLISSDRVAVSWDSGDDLQIALSGIVFLEQTQSYEEIVNFESITINGKCYKLVPVEEE